MNLEITKLLNEKGMMLEKELFNLLGEFRDLKEASVFLDNLARLSGQKLITKSTLIKNTAYAKQIVNSVPGEMKSIVEKTFVTLGISLSIEKHTEVRTAEKQEYRVFYADTKNNKKV